MACRRCGYEHETLPHVLNHCMRNSPLYTARHNEVVARIRVAAASRLRILTENQTVDDSRLRPDLVITDGTMAYIIDVSIPFEDHLAYFMAAHDRKLEHYAGVATNCHY